MEKMKVPFVALDRQTSIIRTELNDVFNKVLDSNWFVLGSEVDKFERNYATFSSVEYCVGTGNCLESLHFALKVLKVGQGDEVIVPSNTYIATWLAISYVGATIVPVEPDEYYNISVDEVAKKITSKTKAIMAVNLYGLPCKYDKLMILANSKNIFVIEDNAQSQGASYKGVKTGAWGHVNATSFYPMKNLGAYGDGGAITTNSFKFYDRIRALRNYGSREKYINNEVGYNSRLDELQAAFLNVKIPILNEWNKQRRQIANIYNAELQGVGDVKCPLVYEEAEHVYHIYAIRTNKRDMLQKYLSNNEIGTMIHYPIPPHLQKAYKHLGYKKEAFPLAELYADTILSLPIFPGMRDDEIMFVINMIKKFYSRV